MTEIKFRSDLPVELIQHCGSDEMIVRAARVSTNRDEIEAGGTEGLIRYLMQNRHGSPFEHNSMTFRIEAPIMVWREFHRHRVGFSYNELSGRYTQLPAEFYVPAAHRPLVQQGKPGAYVFSPGNDGQYLLTLSRQRAAAEYAYAAYEEQLDCGIAREAARACLPVSIYSVCYVTCNARSLMNFLELRTAPSAQWEIRQVARSMEDEFSELFPVTWAAFDAAGRKAP